MIVIKSTPVVYFDVDNTLVSPGYSYLNGMKLGGIYWKINVPHVKLIKEMKARGHTIVVWSAGGPKWAAQVVKKLKLQDHVDLVIEKPRWYFDDKPASEWMGQPDYIYQS